MKDLIYAYSEFINESKTQKLDFIEFSKARLDGASKIAEMAKKKGGAALLTYQHFVVKLPYYKKAATGKFNQPAMLSELTKLVNDLAKGSSTKIKLNQVQFQRLVGKIEVIGELLIKSQDK